MDVRPHDLLRVESPDAILAASPSPPAWVAPALAETPWVVVRRARAEHGLIPVGVRGRSRSERYAAFVQARAVLERVAPEAIAAARTWETAARRHAAPALSALAAAAGRFDALSLVWGPTGGVGFELTTGRPVLGPGSDVDVLLRTGDGPGKAVAAAVAAAIDGLPARFDVQVETKLGAVALVEIARSALQVLVRTADGPRLLDRHLFAEEPFAMIGTA
jgi:phosphoribosyl-dephospho-CoA transferase